MNNDGKTDVLYANGEQWRYKSAGTGYWIQLAVAAEESKRILLGNFDAGPEADVLVPKCY